MFLIFPLKIRSFFLLCLTAFFLSSSAKAGGDGAYLQNDDRVLHKGLIRFNPDGISHWDGNENRIGTENEQQTYGLTLLSKRFMGTSPSEQSTSDEDVSLMKEAYQAYLSCSTDPRDKKKQAEKENWIRSFSAQCNAFVLRHTFSYSPAFKHINGRVILYPGNNLGILEEEYHTRLYPPQWAVGHITYEIDLDKNLLHILHIDVERLWRSKGIGSALGDYLTEFAWESFPQVYDLTVDCRNSHSSKIFEKSGFKSTDKFKDATHHLSNQRGDSFTFKDSQRLITAFHKSRQQGYLNWLNNNFTRLLPNRLHKVGYTY